MVSVTAGNDTYTYPVVDVSGNDGVTFTERAQLNPKVSNNWATVTSSWPAPLAWCT
jgi:hypothetical protein